MTEGGRRGLRWLPALVLLGCAQLDMLLYKPPAPLDAVVVALTELSYDGMPYEAALRTEDLLAALWTESTWGVLTPGEVHVRADATSVLRQSDLVVLARSLDVNVRQVGLLRSRASLREARADTKMQGTQKGQAPEYSADVVFSLTLYDPEGRAIADLSETRALDPFASHPSSDPRPELREAIVSATRRVVAACQGCFREVPRLPFTVRANPAVALAREGAAPHAPRDTVAKLADEVAALYYFDPDLPMRESVRLRAIRVGFCLLADASSFARGDCIIALDGHTLDGPHRFARDVRRPGKHTVTVVPAGERRPVTRPYGE